MAFAGIVDPHALRQVGRAHVLAWRRDLERRVLGAATIRRKLSALSSLFEALCEANAVQGNPVDGVKRPKIDSQEGKTPAIGNHQARELLAAPDTSTLQGLRDRAMLATLLYHGLRRAELCALRLADLQDRRSVRHLQVHGKGSKIRYVPLHPIAADAIAGYLEAAGHGDEKAAPLFRPVSNNARGARAITPDGVYKVLAKYAAQVGIDVDGFGPHALRAAAITNALDNDADLGLGPSVGWACEHLDNSHVRPSPAAAGGQPDVQGPLLNVSARLNYCASLPTGWGPGTKNRYPLVIEDPGPYVLISCRLHEYCVHVSCFGRHGRPAGVVICDSPP